MAEILDQSNASGTIDIGWGDVGSDRDFMCQGFIPTLNNVTAISFNIRGKSGDPNQGYLLWIDAANANSEPLGVKYVGVGGVTEITNAQLVTGATTKYTLTTPATGLTIGNQYCFVLAPWNTSTDVFSGDYQDFRCSVANPYANGRRNHGNTAYNAWNAPDSGNADLLFETYGNEPVVAPAKHAFNNYQFVSAVSAGVMSVTEKIR
jgi:hypothetical protein